MTVSSRILATFLKDHKIFGPFRLAVYGKVLQGEAELLEQHDRERCVSVGVFYQLADSISKETGMPIEEVDKLIQNMSAAADPGNPGSMQGVLKTFGMLTTNSQRLLDFLATQAQLADQKRSLVTCLLIGRGDYLDDAEQWVKLEPGDWNDDATAKLPTDLLDELQAFLVAEKAVMTAAGKPPAPATPKRPRTRTKAS